MGLGFFHTPQTVSPGLPPLRLACSYSGFLIAVLALLLTFGVTSLAFWLSFRLTLHIYLCPFALTLRVARACRSSIVPRVHGFFCCAPRLAPLSWAFPMPTCPFLRCGPARQQFGFLHRTFFHRPSDSGWLRFSRLPICLRVFSSPSTSVMFVPFLFGLLVFWSHF